MIVLLTFSNDLSGKNENLSHSFKGVEDSVLVSYDDLRRANAKMIELKYEKEINKRLKVIIDNDSIVISQFKINNNKLEQKVKKVKVQRNIFGTSSIIAIFALIIALL